MLKDQKILFTLNNLRISSIIGIHQHERHAKQELIFSLSAVLEQNLENNHKYENPKLSLALSALIKNYCEKHKPLLLERMAFEIAQEILASLHVMSLSLEIRKPNALKQAAYSYVKIHAAKPYLDSP